MSFPTLPPLPLSTPVLVLALLASYLLAQRLLRFRRLSSHNHPFPTRASMASMTLPEAYAIHLALSSTEFPYTISQSLFFALFKTYGIPSISSLLLHTSELSGPTASKRAADTSVLLTELFLHPPEGPGSERGRRAMARMNYLHAKWRKAGRITDGDMLYTLSLFVLEPERWVARYEWRALGEVERCARGVYWRWVGEGMGIDMGCLLAYRVSVEGEKAGKEGQGWTDGLEWLEALTRWSVAYEEQHMLPAESNRKVADGTVQILLTNVPGPLKGMAEEGIRVMMEPRLRRSMMFEDPSAFATWMLLGVLAVRKWILRYLALPRPWILRWRWFDDEPDSEGRVHSLQYTSHPWYVKPTTGWRWGPKGLLLRLVGGSVPGDDGERYLPHGYKIEEVGPQRQVGKGLKEMEAEIERLGLDSKGTCPFAKW
ncbi:Hypothetical protein D9617_3g022110 [Elsinoe fawcettii]|nr:Hypothetical protein D9617_3g022110 [Elsinoe fawcettii]